MRDFGSRVRLEGLENLPVLDMHDPELKSDSNGVLARLRKAGPLCHVSPFGTLGVLTFAEVDTVLRDPKTFSSEAQFLPPVPGAEEEAELRILMLQDPPVHTRVRGLVNRAFSPSRVEALEKRVRGIAHELVTRMLTHHDEVDLVEELAVPLPMTVIGELLGVERSDLPNLKRWSDSLQSQGATLYAPPGPERDRQLEELRTCAFEMDEYFKNAVARRRREPTDDLIHAIVAANDEGQVLSDREVRQLVKIVLIAANETTTKFLTLLMNTLISHPRELELLQSSPELAASAVEEALRYDGPVMMQQRIAVAPATIAGFAVASGAQISLVLPSANHDETVFEDPDVFNIRRKIRRHMAFGGGIHVCVGAALARVEARIALEEIVARIDGLAFAEPPVRARTFMRGFDKMLVRLTPRTESVGASPSKLAPSDAAPAQ